MADDKRKSNQSGQHHLNFDDFDEAAQKKRNDEFLTSAENIAQTAVDLMNQPAAFPVPGFTEVARPAGYARSSMHTYFPSKEQLNLASATLIFRKLDTILSRIDETMDEKDHKGAILRSLEHDSKAWQYPFLPHILHALNLWAYINRNPEETPDESADHSVRVIKAHVQINRRYQRWLTKHLEAITSDARKAKHHKNEICRILSSYYLESDSPDMLARDFVRNQIVP